MRHHKAALGRVCAKSGEFYRFATPATTYLQSELDDMLSTAEWRKSPTEAYRRHAATLAAKGLVRRPKPADPFYSPLDYPEPRTYNHAYLVAQVDRSVSACTADNIEATIQRLGWVRLT